MDTADGMRWVPTPQPSSIVGLSPVTAPVPAAPGSPAPTQAQQDAFASISAVLTEYDLGSLSNQVWQWIVEGRSEIEVSQLLRQTTEFRTRFKAIEARREAGLPAISPAEVLAYERQAREVMRRNGLPEGFYDSPDDYVAFLVGDVSVRELEERVVNAYSRIQMAPQSVRDKFTEFFGVTGEGGLAAFVLDPDRATPLLMRSVAEAETAGIGRDFGFDFNQTVASRIAGAGVSADQARAGFAQLGQIKPLFEETVSEAEDIGALDAGVESVFGLGEGADQVERRRQQRAAYNRGGGGAAITRTGSSGLGSAN